jgi:opacity protein-like surface antigen
LYKKTTIDLAFGLGAAYNITKNISVSLQLRVDYGFSDLEKKDFTYSGAEFWDHDRAGTHNATGGALIGLNYKLLKKAAEPAKGKPAPAKKK